MALDSQTQETIFILKYVGPLLLDGKDLAAYVNTK